jgi:selenide,water dikinase
MSVRVGHDNETNRLGAMSAQPHSTRLTEWTSCGGCAAKWGASLLADLVKELPNSTDTFLLVGLAPFDDAAVYRLTDDLALVSTTDFFPPLVDDPSDFGAIAAANACSDVFAMGGSVVLAVNIAAFPEDFPREWITQIFDAASTVVADAGGTIAGGHTIRNPEPIFGLAVQGTVHPDRIFRKSGARPGDVAVLSKPIGTGLVMASGTDGEKQSAISVMRMINRQAAEQLRQLGDAVHAVTDVTGYGLAGHGWEIADRSGVQLVIHHELIPLYDGALKLAQSGARTGGDPRNRTYVSSSFSTNADDAYVALTMDPQTSGGLLAAVDPQSAAQLVNTSQWTIIGEFTNEKAQITLV